MSSTQGRKRQRGNSRRGSLLHGWHADGQNATKEKPGRRIERPNAVNALARKLEADERRAFAGQQGSDLLGAKNSSQMENTRFIHDQQRQTQMTMREQDDMLEELDGAVDRTHNMAITIQDELKDQRNMLDSLESDLEETSDKMQFAMSKLQKLLKTKDSCQIWTIVALVIVLLVLVFLAIYM